jgi:hypothetical protein
MKISLYPHRNIILTWSIISAVSGVTLNAISVSCRRSGIENARLFPQPVPTSTITSSPQRIAVPISICYAKATWWSMFLVRVVRASQLSSCGWYIRTDFASDLLGGPDGSDVLDFRLVVVFENTCMVEGESEFSVMSLNVFLNIAPNISSTPITSGPSTVF